MARYIDADKADVRSIHSSYMGYSSWADVLEWLQSQPTADVEEVKHGRWIEQDELYGDVYYTCSICNNDWTTIDGTPQENFMNYCPHCGAKMDGGKAE